MLGMNEMYYILYNSLLQENYTFRESTRLYTRQDGSEQVKMLYMNIVGQTETVLPSGERVCVCVSVCETTKSTRAEKFDR